jgi:hypothetical protein
LEPHAIRTSLLPSTPLLAARCVSLFAATCRLLPAAQFLRAATRSRQPASFYPAPVASCPLPTPPAVYEKQVLIAGCTLPATLPSPSRRPLPTPCSRRRSPDRYCNSLVLPAACVNVCDQPLATFFLSSTAYTPTRQPTLCLLAYPPAADSPRASTLHPSPAARCLPRLLPTRNKCSSPAARYPLPFPRRVAGRCQRPAAGDELVTAIATRWCCPLLA